MKKIDYYEICNQKLKYLNYSDRTIKSYLFYINQFLNNIKIAPTRLTSEDFQSYLDNYQFTSTSQQNQVINSIRFLYKFGLNKKYDKVSFKRHSCFTNLLENGTDLRLIQKIAGTHVSNQLLSKVILPI